MTLRRSTKASLSLLALLVFAAGPSEKHAVARRAAATSVDQAVSEKEPGWKLVRTYESLDNSSRLWSPLPLLEEKGEALSEEERESRLLTAVWMSLRTARSEQEAIQEYKMSVLSMAIGPGEKIEGLGDDGYVLVNYNGRGRTRASFRRENYIVAVSGPSVDVAERFSQYILEAVEKRIAAEREP